MKAPRLVLVGLGILVLTLVAWLQHDQVPEAAPASHASSSSSSEVVIGPPPESAAPAPLPSHAEAPGQMPEQAPAPSAVLARAFALPPGFERQQLVERFGFDAAKDDIAAALQNLAGITNPADRQAMLRGIFARAAEGAPADAISAVKSLPIEVDRETALTALLAQWRPAPVLFEQQRAVSERFGAMGAMLAKLLDNPSLAAECARDLLSGYEKVTLLGAAAAREAATDPQRALSFGAGLAGNEQAQFKVGFVAGWARISGDAAWAWSLQEPDPATRQALQASALEGWATRDPQSAALQLGQVEDAEARTKVITALGTAWGGTDTQAALVWANSLTNAGERDAAVAAISSQAPVGIGVVLKSDDSGYPVIGGLVPGGPASMTGGIRDGYQIAAVSDGNGYFTDLRGRTLSDVASLLRGKPGSSVYLQVIEPGGNPATRRTVVMTRRQLLFKQAGG